MLRGYVYFGLLAFVPLYETQERGRSATYGAVLLTLMLGAGAVATLGTGRIADRVGVNAVMLGATAVVAAGDPPLPARRRAARAWSG